MIKELKPLNGEKTRQWDVKINLHSLRPVAENNVFVFVVQKRFSLTELYFISFSARSSTCSVIWSCCNKKDVCNGHHFAMKLCIRLSSICSLWAHLISIVNKSEDDSNCINPLQIFKQPSLWCQSHIFFLHLCFSLNQPFLSILESHFSVK